MKKSRAKKSVFSAKNSRGMKTVAAIVLCAVGAISSLGIFVGWQTASVNQNCASSVEIQKKKTEHSLSCSSAFFVLRRSNLLPLSIVAKIVFRNQNLISRRREPRKNAVRQRKKFFHEIHAPVYESGLPLSRKTFVFDYNFLPLKNQPKRAKNHYNVFRKFNQPFR